MRNAIEWVSIGLICLVLLVSCENKPKAIDYGHDACDFCRMTITDQRYGAELVTKKGKIHKFDSIECLAAFSEKEKITDGSYWVTDYSQPGVLVEATSAFFLQSPAMKSPMGLNYTAFSKAEDRDSAQKTAKGKSLNWDELRTEVAGSSFLNQTTEAMGGKHGK